MRKGLTDCLPRRLYLALFSVLAGAGLVLMVLRPVSAAPTEEDIPQSAPAPRHVKARPEAAPAQQSEAAPDSPAAAPGPAAPGSAAAEPSDNPASAAAGPEAAPASAAAPTAPAGHKFFPYTIRSGDTLETIADIFGVQVADITRYNRRIADGDLMAGDTSRRPNPFATREAELNSEVERLSIEKEEATRKADQSGNALTSLHSELDAAASTNANYEHDLHTLPWWRAAAWTAEIGRAHV